MNFLRSLSIMLLLISVSCKQNEAKKSEAEPAKEKTEKVEQATAKNRPHITLNLECSNGYVLAFQYLDNDKATLKITSDGKTRTFNMNHVPANGEKYISDDKSVEFWMHQGEGTLTENGKDLCNCVMDQ